MRMLVRDDVALAYEEAGRGDPPLLLVHGWTCDHSFFAPKFEHFSRTHRVVNVDLRGHGESDKPLQDYTVAGASPTTSPGSASGWGHETGRDRAQHGR
jgi:pimeloyl-ACP methyl ester carboxylesterase